MRSNKLSPVPTYSTQLQMQGNKSCKKVRDSTLLSTIDATRMITRSKKTQHWISEGNANSKAGGLSMWYV
jgi:hypothetical protein